MTGIHGDGSTAPVSAVRSGGVASHTAAAPVSVVPIGGGGGRLSTCLIGGSAGPCTTTGICRPAWTGPPRRGTISAHLGHGQRADGEVRQLGPHDRQFLLENPRLLNPLALARDQIGRASC